MTQDPRPRHSVVQDPGRRRSTLDSSGRPPVIVTTTQKQQPGSTHSSSHRNPSPVRHSHRASEGQFFTQPASTTRSRPNAPLYSPTSLEDDYSRSRDRTDSFATRDAEAYRNTRPSVVYPSDPRHSTAAVDYGDEGYQYTNAGELARYDLDHPKRARSRHRESMDRGYYRPNISYNAEQRSLNINTSADLSRNYAMNTSRPYEGGGRGGPPPSTRGFDKINRSFDSNPDVPPTAPSAPAPAMGARLGDPNPSSSTSSEWRDGRRNRPVSLYQEGTGHSSHHDDYYRSREDERNVRELRDRERESDRTRDSQQFYDESVPSRGFGIRTGPAEAEHDGRRDRDYRREETRRRSDEDLPPRGSRDSDMERDGRYRGRADHKDDRRESRDGRRNSDDENGRDRSRLRDKLTSGVGIAAAAMGLKSAMKGDEPDSEPRRRRSPSQVVVERRIEPERSEQPAVTEREKLTDRSRDKDKDRDNEREREWERQDSKDRADARARNRREAEARLNGDTAVSASDSDEGRKGSRGRRLSIGFNPNDASDISKLREQLKTSDKDKDKDKEEVQSRPAIVETRRARSQSRTRSRSRSRSGSVSEHKDAQAPRDSKSKLQEEDDSRGRMVVAAPESEMKMVRVVSPPRDKSDEKPLKGILKQPKDRFPEPSSFVREGAAPHKEDKKAKEVPPGARWTKISRKVVNPEALTIGKERFEVRDDFVIVLRVLSKEEIQAYASATQVLRERRRDRGGAGGDDEDKEKEREKDKDDDRDYDDDGRRRRRHRRHHGEDDDDDYRRERERDDDRRRRNGRKEEDDEPYERRSTRDSDSYHHRSHRERERERAAEI